MSPKKKQTEDFPSYRIAATHAYHVENEKGEKDCGVDIVEQGEGLPLWLSNLYVAPQFRGQGVARAMMRRLLTDWGHRDIALRTMPYADRPLPPDALAAFYASFGFVPSETPGIMLRKGVERG